MTIPWQKANINTIDYFQYNMDEGTLMEMLQNYYDENFPETPIGRITVSHYFNYTPMDPGITEIRGENWLKMSLHKGEYLIKGPDKYLYPCSQNLFKVLFTRT